MKIFIGKTLLVLGLIALMVKLQAVYLALGLIILACVVFFTNPKD